MREIVVWGKVLPEAIDLAVSTMEIVLMMSGRRWAGSSCGTRRRERCAGQDGRYSSHREGYLGLKENHLEVGGHLRGRVGRYSLCPRGLRFYGQPLWNKWDS